MRARLAMWLVRLAARLVGDDGDYEVYLNLRRVRSNNGRIYAFLAERTPDHRTATSWPRGDGLKLDGWVPVPEWVASLAGWEVHRPLDDV